MMGEIMNMRWFMDAKCPSKISIENNERVSTSS